MKLKNYNSIIETKERKKLIIMWPKRRLGGIIPSSFFIVIHDQLSRRLSMACGSRRTKKN
jgi:hypothetical protein